MKTESRPSTVTVNTTDTQIVRNRPDRVALVITNISNTEIHIDIDNTVSSSSGIKLDAGVTVSFNLMEDGELVNRRWFGVATTVAGTVRVFEVVKIEADN